jgi:hypothetical protein
MNTAKKVARRAECQKGINVLTLVASIARTLQYCRRMLSHASAKLSHVSKTIRPGPPKNAGSCKSLPCHIYLCNQWKPWLTSVRGNRGEIYENEPLVRQKHTKKKKIS